MELNTFLVKAKASTYATGRESEEKVLAGGCKEFTYVDKNFKYRDKYFGYNPFVGEELVWKDNKLYWTMNYYGKIISDEISISKVYEFLKKSLKKVTESLPFRGPKGFQEDEFEYVNKIEGDISNFIGNESIYYKKKKIYFLQYHGGFISSKD